MYTYTILPCMATQFETLAEAARQLGIAPSTLRHQIRAGRFVAQKIGRGWFATTDEIARYRAEVQGRVA